MVLAPAASAVTQDDLRRWPAEHPSRGLPRDPAAFVPYSEATDHPWNRVFRRLWLRQLQPAEVGAPADVTTFRVGAKWALQKRDGTPADQRWFGGDGRLLPCDGLPAAEATQLAADLAAVAADGIGSMRPELAVLFQHDLLRAAERLLDTGQNAELLAPLAGAIHAVALPADVLHALPDPLKQALRDPAVHGALAAQLPAVLGGTATGYREVTRRSTRLFDAGKTLLWSRVFLRHPADEAALAALLPPADGKGGNPTVPLGFRAVLVQGLVAVDRDGVPQATPMVFDLRLQHLVHRDGLAADDPTFTRDGIDFDLWQLERQGVRQATPAGLFRRIAADDHDLFRDYGTSKHTTYRGQCSLCHRQTDGPEPELGGFPVLRPHARAAFAVTGEERLRLAEQQAASLLAKLPAAR